ncbi:glycosyltransferase family 2 protein [Clostridium oryzae]|uniref:Poly-beta-1,6-N-acetyl-D-glucosamine synthase n=1 Tax=Clostridium oryzae TaxID=1450648 RepID=A0A1V4I571_9CLOT|nr:glycosyltransferase family 2 protein [Clostridium oryzae]OPJ55121.1 poly-beta-1,6-N-acetyl-D-glucosamine synthase [Clostridium oryzae]
MSTPLVSIVTICWNRRKDILESLKGIYEVEYDNLEVIVVDNCSTDGTCEEIRKQYPKVKLIEMFKNIGIEAYNIGFKNAQGEYIVILDDDSFPHKYSVKRMVEKFKQDEKLGMVAFDVRNYYNYDEVKASEDEEDINEDTSAKAKDYLMAFNGAGAAVRRELLERVGFYPEEFFLYWNEQDTAFRILDTGYKIEFFSDVVSYHKYSPKNRASWRAPFYYTRNAFWLIWKNYPMNAAVRLTINMVYDCFYYSMEQKTFIYIKAMFNAIFNANKIKGKRKVVGEYIWKNFRIPFNVSFTFFK